MSVHKVSRSPRSSPCRIPVAGTRTSENKVHKHARVSCWLSCSRIDWDWWRGFFFPSLAPSVRLLIYIQFPPLPTLQDRNQRQCCLDEISNSAPGCQHRWKKKNRIAKNKRETTTLPQQFRAHPDLLLLCSSSAWNCGGEPDSLALCAVTFNSRHKRHSPG